MGGRRGARRWGSRGRGRGPPRCLCPGPSVPGGKGGGGSGRPFALRWVRAGSPRGRPWAWGPDPDPRGPRRRRERARSRGGAEGEGAPGCVLLEDVDDSQAAFVAEPELEPGEWPLGTRGLCRSECFLGLGGGEPAGVGRAKDRASPPGRVAGGTRPAGPGRGWDRRALLAGIVLEREGARDACPRGRPGQPGAGFWAVPAPWVRSAFTSQGAEVPSATARGTRTGEGALSGLTQGLGALSLV